MKEKLCILLLFLLVAASGKAQDFYPGPGAQNLTEGKNVMVDHATGLFHYKAPLYRLKSGDYELPISLDYIAKGVKKHDPTGLIGKNWTLNIGGIVTRTMRGGFADEEGSFGCGYLWAENAATPLKQDARNVGLRKRDGESDIFTAVFNGKKVDFIIRMNEDRHIYALPLGQTDVRIECEGITGIGGWTITDSNGDRYIYRQKEMCTDAKYVNVSTSNAISNSEYISAWHLTRILPYNGAPIDFHYNANVKNLPTGNIPEGYMDTYIGDSYKMTYHYGEPVKKQPFDFKKYLPKFSNAIGLARDYLSISTLQIRFENTDSKIGNFLHYGQINVQPLLGQYIEKNNRIAGLLSNISEITSASKDLEESLRSMSKYCRSVKNTNANIAGGFLQEAADYVHACLSEVREIETQEMQGGSGYTVLSPLLDKIVFPEHIVKFTYHSVDYLSAISLHNRDMELISSASFTGETLTFFDKDGKKTSNMKFDYYEKSDFPDWEEAGEDLWGYPVAQSGNEKYEDCEECEMYATLYSLKRITLSDGGKIEIGYEKNEGVRKRATVGGIRLKSLIFSDKQGEQNDTISYGYPSMSVSVYNSYSSKVRVYYSHISDRIDYGRVQLEGHPVVNMGNNGLYYPDVTETVSGKGTTAYSYKVVSPSSETEIPYSYWLNGLLMEKSVYDVNGKLLKKVRYNYEIEANRENKLPQMQPSNFYLDGESLESFYNGQGTPYLTGRDFYQLYIKPRLTPTNTDKFYNMQYGWKIALKEEVEYRSDENIPYCQTKYCYDNPVSMYPTRIIHIGSDDIERTEVLKRVMDMADSADSVFVKMKEANLLLPVVKSLTLIDGKLVSETVCRYQADKESKIGSIAPIEELIYIPDTPEVYVQAVVDTLLFTHGESNYTTEVSYKYASQKTSRIRVETNGRTERKSYVYDNYGKLLLECDTIGTAACDMYDNLVMQSYYSEIRHELNNLEKYQQDFLLTIESIKSEVTDEQFVRFLRSEEHSLIISFAKKISNSGQNLYWARYYYRDIVYDNYEIFNKFKQEYERMIGRYPKYKKFKRFIDIMETLIHFSEQQLFDLYFLKYEIEKPVYDPDLCLNLTPALETRNLQLYILDGYWENIGVDISYAGGETTHMTKNLSSSKLKIYNIDLSEYTDILSVHVFGRGSYAALVPEGANFKATSYNADGTVYAQFDQSGNVEYYTYDTAGRVIRVEDQDGNILKKCEYNKLLLTN